MALPDIESNKRSYFTAGLVGTQIGDSLWEGKLSPCKACQPAGSTQWDGTVNISFGLRVINGDGESTTIAAY